MRNAISFLLLAMATVVSQAATFNVTQFNDPQPAFCDVGACSLRGAVLAANDTPGADMINLPAGAYLISLVGNDSGPETGDLDITNDVTIRGVGAIIDAQQQGRALDITNDANVTLEDITVRNALSSLATNGALNAGGLEITGGSLTLRRVTFRNNESQGLGGAVRAADGAVVTIEDSEFIDNTGSSGGAISASVELTIIDSLFDNNRADTLGGGALSLTGSSANTLVRGVTFMGNSADGTGGAIGFTGSTLTVRDSFFISNEAGSGDRGGAIFFSGTGHVKTLDVMDTTFDNNMASSGGAIEFPDQTDVLRLSRCTFVGNDATEDGGAIRVIGGDVELTNATFSGNQAVDAGGAIYVSATGGATVDVRHVTFADNQADRGEALFTTGSGNPSVTISNSIIAEGCDVGDPAHVVSAGGNVEGPGDTCELDQGTDLTSQTLGGVGLSALADNGGATETYQLSAGSVARNQGVPTVCDDVFGDQRGGVRDSDCDAGSVEAAAVPDDLIFRDDFQP